jgi:mRNA interferase RelE/StbE
VYQVIIKREALKELKQLPKRISVTITFAIEELAKEPRPHGCKKLKGSHENLWRIRVGDYRVIYLIDDIVRVINVRNIGNRKDVYE